MNHPHQIILGNVYNIAVAGHNVSVTFTHDAPNGEINVHNVHVEVLAPVNEDLPFPLFLHQIMDRAFQIVQHFHPQGTQNHERVYTSLEITHDSFHSSNHHWYSTNHVYSEAQQRIVDQWDTHAQSNHDVNLRGQSEWIFQFILDVERHAARHHFYSRRVGDIERSTPYPERKKRMFTPYRKEMVFNMSYISEIPSSEKQLCFPTAFFISQCRSIQLEPHANYPVNVVEVRESTEINITKDGLKGINKRYKSKFQLENGPYATFEDPTGVKDSLGCYYLIPIISSYDQTYFQKHLSNYVYKNHLVLFNCLKLETNESNKPDWGAYEYAAEFIHSYVEEQLGRTVDVTDLDEVANAYAHVFQVNIHLRRFEFVNRARTDVFKNPFPVTDGFDRHVSLLLQLNEETNVEHCHAICDIRGLAKSKLNVKDTFPSGYCDYCCRCITSNNGTKEGNLEHIRKCHTTFLENGHITNLSTGNCHFMNSAIQRDFEYNKKKEWYTCKLCQKKEIKANERQEHQCYMPHPDSGKIKYNGEDVDIHKYFVFDMECAQDLSETNPNSVRLKHHCTLICIRSMYDKSEYAKSFESLESFVEELITNEIFEKATLFAHNGGAYDFQFILHYMEQNQMLHEKMPRPGSLHKYLSLTIIKTNGGNITFKDFMMFMPGALKDIAVSLGCNLNKGDFPHKFHTLQRFQESYIGSIPPIDSDEDFYCLKQKKKESEVTELKAWHQSECAIYCTCYKQLSCSCGKQPWKFKEQLETYCWLDVDVLAECMMKFREQHIQMGSGSDGIAEGEWQLKPIDPYLLTTQSQVAQKILLRGLDENKMPAVSHTRSRHGWSKASIGWLEYISNRDHIHIQHAGNSDKEYWDQFTQKKIDGYCKTTKTAYEFYGCYYHGCPKCFTNRNAYHTLHSNQTIEEVYENTITLLEKLNDSFAFEHVKVIWECEWNEMKLQIDPNEVKYYEELSENIITDREMFYGGRTEVFCPHVQADEEHSLDYIDVCSLYPTVCARDELPIGHPTFYFGYEAERQRYRLCKDHPDRIFGYVRCHIIPNTNDYIGLLPSHTDGKLLFDVRPKTGVWFTEEIYLAMRRGYTIQTIYEIFHFDANNRSNTFMKGYMSYFFRQKQEAEGWKKAGCSSENPTEDEKDAAICRLQAENPDMLPMRKEMVLKNDVKRQVAKIYLNCLWGKFGQSPEQTLTKAVYGFEDFQKLLHDCNLDKTTLKCRKIWRDYYQCVYKNRTSTAASNKNYNVCIAAAVTAHARCRLHEMMLRIGEDKIAYCDTDSIIYRHLRTGPSYEGKGLGNWVSEFAKDEIFIEFYALAPKAYMCIYTKNGELKSNTKSKGVRLTLTNKEKLTSEVHQQLIKRTIWFTSTGVESTIYFPLLLEHFTIQTNSSSIAHDYATVFSIYSKKLVQAVYTKREIETFDFSNSDEQEFIHFQLPKVLRTFPYGYLESLKENTETVSMCIE